MPYFHRFQGVRIVHAIWEDGTTYTEMVGKECILMEADETWTGKKIAPAWVTNISHPRSGQPYRVLESMIEPLQFDFDKEEEEEEELEFCPIIVNHGDVS